MKIISLKSGVSWIPVHGRAYPEAGAYPSSVTAQPVTSLTKYSIPAGQSYVTSGVAETGDFYGTININGDGGPGDRVLVTGTTQYYPIRYNHRLAYVRASDVQFAVSTSAKSATARADPCVPVRSHAFSYVLVCSCAGVQHGADRRDFGPGGRRLRCRFVLVGSGLRVSCRLGAGR